MKLKCDIRGTFNSTHIYGLKNDEVKIISDMGTQLIVEHETGGRFSVNADQLQGDEDIESTAAPVVKTEEKKVKAMPFNQAPPLKKQNKQQINLFE